MESLQINFNFAESYLSNNIDALHFKKFSIIEDLDQGDHFPIQRDQVVGSIHFAETSGNAYLAEFAKFKSSFVTKSPQKRSPSTNLPVKPKKQPSVSKQLDFTQNSTSASNGANGVSPQPKTQMFAECMINGQKTYMCTLCTYKTTYNSAIHRHGRSAHGDNLPSYKCSTCDFSTPEKAKLKHHYMKLHNLGEVIAKAAVDATEIS